MHTSPALEVKDLVCSYAGRGMFASGSKRMVIDGLTFSVGEGECLGLLGNSGSGKSTIARCVAGLEEPEAGSISILGHNVFPARANRKRIARKVQMLYQDHAASLDPVLTIGESLAEALPRGRTSGTARSDNAAAMTRLLGHVGLAADVLGRYPRSLSGGERQRAALARALAADPAVLVLDEPTSALDASTQAQILDLIASIQHARRTAILFISHDVEAVARLCSHIAVLHGGRIVEHGPVHMVLDSPKHPYTREIAGLRG